MAITPLVKRGEGAFHVERRFWISALEISTFKFALGNIEDDGVAVLYCSDGTATRGFGSDVASHETVRCAGESAVGEQRDGIAEALADERGGYREHFAHARTAFRAFVANHDDVARFDL